MMRVDREQFLRQHHLAFNSLPGDWEDAPRFGHALLEIEQK